MGQVYLEGVIEEGVAVVGPDSATCLALLTYLQSPLEISFLPPSSPPSPSLSFSLPFPLPPSIPAPPPPSSLCSAPVFSLDDNISCVSGLAAVLRQISKESGEEGKKLLGFRDSCLAAPSETSPFVWFCEVGAVGEQSVALERLEHHLSLPVRVHNVDKYKTLLENGRFVEGPHFLLTDVVLAVAIDVILQTMKIDSLEDYPHISTWFSRVKTEKNLGRILEKIKILSSIESNNSNTIVFKRPLGSLYKRDPTRYKPRHKIFTQQSEIESSLELISSLKMMEIRRTEPVSLPDFVPLPDVPSERKERKSQQIQSFISAALKIVREGDIIVDFCAGSGHVGLALATLLPPSCRVVILDNKEGSLGRARQKISELGLENVWLVQANLGYFAAKFQVGMALHACGVASDLVLQKCLDKGANLVLCPCCYGGIQTNDKLRYPQSEKFRETGLSERGYIVLGHSADQSGEQGERSMLAVDTDRCFAASEKGYKVELTKLEPLTCSTRNNLILAVKE